MLPALITGVLGTLLKNNMPGIAQAVVDKGINYVEDKLGLELKPDMSPEELKALQEAATKHEEFKIEQYNKNTADARAMQVAALTQEDVFAKRFTLYLAMFWSLAAVVYIAFVTFGEIPLANTRFADTILGFLLGTIISTIMNFFFGSSMGSKEKDEINKKLQSQ